MSEPHGIFCVHGENDLDYPDGYLMLTRAIGANPDDRNGENFRRFPHTKIVRLNYGYAPAGTIPTPDRYEDFAQRVRNFVEFSTGCHIWIIGNEPNMEIERPQGQPILPQDYAECYRLCRQAIKSLKLHGGDQVLVAPVAPWNVGTKYPDNPSGDWIRYFEDLQYELLTGGCDGFAIHTYARAQTPQSVTSSARMDPPFQAHHGGFRTYIDWMAAIEARFQGLPVYLTEFCVADKPWRDANTGFVQAVYAEIDDWNRQRSDRPISCAALYRWQHDMWAIKDKPGVHRDFAAAVEHGYTVPPTDPEPPEEDTMLLNPSFEQPYRQASPQHSTVIVAHDWEYFASDGKPPERDGPCQLPEYKPLTRNEDPRRVFDGDAAQCWFIRWKIFDAGVYQRIEAEQGAKYVFSVMCQAWCSDSNDPTVSDGDMHVMLGIDPAGGVDWKSDAITWTNWQRVGADYLGYASELVEAQADQITIFIRAWNKWELSHNDIYVDAAQLVKEGGGTPPGGGEVDYALIRQIVREELDKTVWASGTV